MKPVGTILKNARKQEGLTIDDIQKKTKIRVKYLRLIEQNEWDALPAVTYTRGFIKTYAESVRLDANRVLALFRREYRGEKSPNVVPKHELNEAVGSSPLVLTIKRILSKLFT